MAGGESITPTERDAVINRTEPWPVQYCTSLYDHTYNGSLVNRTFAYTNRPIGSDQTNIEDSLLVVNIMARVQKTVNDFLMPICRTTNFVIGNITNVTLEFKEAELCKSFLVRFSTN